jgi:hypothetical protein
MLRKVDIGEYRKVAGCQQVGCYKDVLVIMQWAGMEVDARMEMTES